MKIDPVLEQMAEAIVRAELDCNTERPLAKFVREEQARIDTYVKAHRPQYEQRDGYRVRVRP